MLNMKIARIRARMTQKELGDKVGLSIREISRYENGHNYPTVPKLHKIAKILNVTTDYLLKDSIKYD